MIDMRREYRGWCLFQDLVKGVLERLRNIANFVSTHTENVVCLFVVNRDFYRLELLCQSLDAALDGRRIWSTWPVPTHCRRSREGTKGEKFTLRLCC